MYLNSSFQTYKKNNHLYFLLISLLLILFPANELFGTTYSHTIGSKTWSAYGDQVLSGITWTSAGTTTSYFGYDATKGQQFGSASSPATSLTLSTTGIAGTITSVKVTTSGASSIAGTVSVSVGGSTLSPASVALSSSSTAYEFTGSKSGQIIISWAQTSSKAIYLKAIEVTYSNSAVTEAPTFSPVAGTYTSAQNVTLTSATQGAKIYYTTDGTTPDNTKILYQTAIVVSSTTTIKAIAYDSSNQNASSVVSAIFTINNSGSTAPSAPVATDATAISTTGFTANWNAVETAIEYKLNVNKQSGGGNTTILSENFDKFSGGATGSGASSTDISTSLDDYTQTVGWTGSKIYQAGGTAKVGTSSVQGYVVTPAIDLSANGGAFTLMFKSMAWSTDATDLSIYLNDVLVFTASGLDNSTYTLNDYTVQLTGGTSSSKIKFEGKQAAKGRFFLDDLKITQGGVSLTPIEGSPFTVVGSTNKSLIGLIPSTTYTYNLTAKNAQGQESTLSNNISVTTIDGITPTIIASTSQLSDFTYMLNHGPSAVQSFTVSGANLLGNISISAPADFEISATENSGYSAAMNLTPVSGTVTSTKIYVRLKAGLAIEDYSNEMIMISASSAENKTIMVNGIVTEEVVEPSEHVTNFSASVVSPTQNSITLIWTDAIGADAYLIKGSSVSLANIADPIDGVAEIDGALVKNIAKGVQTAVITGLNPVTTYYFKIWPYLGNGASINYKTDGNVPATQATTTTVSGNINTQFSEKIEVYADVNRQLNVSIKNDMSADAMINIYNIAGQKILNVKPFKTVTSIDLSSQSGVCIVIVSNNGIKSVHKAILK